MRYLILLLLIFAVAESRAQFPQTCPGGQCYPQTIPQFPPTLMVPQTTWQPYQLQGTYYLPPQPPQWWPGKRLSQFWYNRWTTPPRYVPYYSPVNQ